MRIEANSVLKYGVPLAVLVAGVIALRACHNGGGTSDQQAAANQAKAQPANQLTPAEMKALGLGADTPENSVATLVAQMHRMNKQLADSQKESAKLREQNHRLATKNQNVKAQIKSAMSIQQQQDTQNRQSLVDKINRRMAELRASLSVNGNNGGQANNGRVPVGLGLKNNKTPAGAKGQAVTWVNPLGTHASPGGTGQGQPSSGDGDTSAFSSAFSTGEQTVATASSHLRQTVTGASELAAAVPVYTVPKNATLTGSVAMTALLGRVPINGAVEDPYPFKVVIGPDDLTANGIEVPEVQGAIVSGVATGDWTLSCVRGTVKSITFIFQDGRVVTVPKSKKPGKSDNNNQKTQDIGYISNPQGVPCVAGTRKTNARSFILTDLLLSAGAGAANAVSGGQTTTRVSGFGATQGVTGNIGKYIAGQAATQGISEVRKWVEKRFGQTFDAIYVPPGHPVAVNIDKTLDIDYDPNGRKVHDVANTRSQSLD
jgi:integrating conjugative element protein (TIGR03752 family)